MLQVHVREMESLGIDPLYWLYTVGDSVASNLKMVRLAEKKKRARAQQLVDDPDSGYTWYFCCPEPQVLG